MGYSRCFRPEARDYSDLLSEDGVEDAAFGVRHPQAGCLSHTAGDGLRQEELYRVAHRDGGYRASATPCFRIDEVSPQDLGTEGERIAAKYLEMRGWVILERNWTCRYGEADLIARDDEECVFVEVKTRIVRSGRGNPYPELAVDGAKRRRYEGIAQCYMAEHGIESARFDIVAVSIVADHMARVHHLVNAFGMEH